MENKRITLLFIFMFVFLPLVGNSVFAKQAMSIEINGVKQSYGHSSIVKNGRTLVPLRGIFEELGAGVQWNEKSRTITAKKGEIEINLAIGSTRANVNRQTVKLDEPAQIVNGRTLVPLRFISESLGAEVSWNAHLNKIVITLNHHSVESQLPVINLPIDSSKYTHQVESNYDFVWRYKHGNYADFHLDGWKDGKIVAGYTTSNNSTNLFPVKIGQSREQLKQALGEPLEHIRKGNVLQILQEQDRLLTYLLEDKYVTYIIDKHKGNKIRAIYWVNKEIEENTAHWYKKSSDKYRQDSEELMYELVNEVRYAEGLPLLKKNEQLATAARKHSEDMVMNNYFNHNNLKGESASKRAEYEGLRANATGENIAMGYRDIIFAHEGLMDSLGHRKNLLNSDYKQLGVGLSFNEKSIPYVTENFYVY